MIDQKTLQSRLRYDPETGLFHWVAPAFRAGKQAGTVNSEGYASIKVLGTHYKSHRLAWLYMTGSFPARGVDHINRIKTDNRWINLRHASDSENAQNKGLGKNNRSGYKGVSWKPRINKWVAQISWRGKVMHLGSFADPKEAARTYALAASVYHTHNPASEDGIISRVSTMSCTP